jgi:hypothetical protein
MLMLMVIVQSVVSWVVQFPGSASYVSRQATRATRRFLLFSCLILQAALPRVSLGLPAYYHALAPRKSTKAHV